MKNNESIKNQNLNNKNNVPNLKKVPLRKRRGIFYILTLKKIMLA
jgi:hypothetical protein